jgi:hypothetical protein
VTQLLDPPMGGSTLYQLGLPTWPDVRAAEDFYLRGCFPARRVVIQVSGGGNVWRTLVASQVEEQINQLLELRAGWDGRRALPPTDDAVRSAIEVLFAVADDLSLAPQVFPLPDGGLQLEWHARESVEIEIDGGGSAHLLTTDESGAIVINRELDPDDPAQRDEARGAMERLTRRMAGAR